MVEVRLVEGTVRGDDITFEDSVDVRVDAERSAPAFDSAELEIVKSKLTVDDWDAKAYGTVKNTGDSPFESVTIIAWFYS
ncbi:hypothetical protein [Halegenticoccus tardaugens]|uniref:hypothetical protein n=1 Tax=Halegenticoccus tardaugens TaxID=2071624 RepID=UPI00100BA069|nr:hypothetical protein [Halegenticoccus tardaugens]